MGTVTVKLNGIAQTGLTITNSSISGQMSNDLVNGENGIEILLSDFSGNQTKYVDTVEGHFPGQEPVPTYIDIDGGWNGCAVAAPDGRVYCWGWNFYGQLLDGTTTNLAIPRKIPGIVGASSVATGAGHICTLMNNKTVKCWGRNEYGEIGVGTVTNSVLVPKIVPGLSNIKQLKLGLVNTCVLDKNNEVLCWGNNMFGQLGFGDQTDRSSPEHISGLTNVTQIAMGRRFTCFLISNGTIKCVGNNEFGQLGNGTNTDSLTFVQVSGISDAVELSAGNNHACVRTAAGNVKCWGRNEHGQLGNQTTSDSNVPVDVIGIQSPVRIDAAQFHTCARSSNDRLLCWGANYSGQLGDGTVNGSLSPVQVGNLSSINVFSIGQQIGCVIQSDSKLKCWGGNDVGGVGNGNFINQPTPVEVAIPQDPVPPIPPTPFTKLLASQNNTCGLRQDGKTFCWGDNNRNKSGPGLSPLVTPSEIQGQFTQYSMGFLHTCATTLSGSVYCWGWNGNGQIGTGIPLFTSTPNPVLIPAITNAEKLSAGAEFNCALLADKTVKCWGDGFVGQLGDGTYNPNQTPQTVLNLSNVVQVSSALKGLHSCAVLVSGAVYCWGNNQRGELGVSPVTTPKSNIPVQVLDINNAIAVTTNIELTCAILQTGKVKCWGGNSHGQLGSGNTVDSYHPTDVLGLAAITEISAGEFYVCANTSSGTTRCWGKNDLGQLGNGITQNSSFPTLAMSGLHSIFTGNQHSCGFDIDQRLWCWGSNSSGQFGNGSTISSTLPMKVGF